MATKYEVTVTAIGNLARTFLENNSSVIILNEGIRPNLADMVLEHTPADLTEDIVEKMYGCPVDLIAHGVPHRVLGEHGEGCDHC